MSGILAALAGSFWLRVSLTALAAAGGLKAYGAYQKHIGRVEGQAQITQKIERKADENAKQAETVREAVAAGKPGRDDPFRVRDR